MNISQLQYLMSAASLGSFTKAASVHHLTVPTISQSIKQLEDEMDTVIFHRTKRELPPPKKVCSSCSMRQLSLKILNRCTPNYPVLKKNM